MYAIIEAGGRQWKVEPGMRLAINRVAGEVGTTHTVDRVLFAQDGQRVQVGTPYLPGAKVVCEIVARPLGPKTIAYHYRRRENWRKTVGSRQRLTALVVKDIQIAGVARPQDGEGVIDGA
ncbi:MAG: 50S ribosomal protein L21 [Candidatus Omnitrophica bacterium]|nr:50S ribosomal protein L21 [Candidatus Omnitrophota bacterium]